MAQATTKRKFLAIFLVAALAIGGFVLRSSVDASPPPATYQVSSIIPANAYPGDIVTIFGSGFDHRDSAALVHSSGNRFKLPPRSGSTHTLEVQLPDAIDPGIYEVIVTGRHQARGSAKLYVGIPEGSSYEPPPVFTAPAPPLTPQPTPVITPAPHLPPQPTPTTAPVPWPSPSFLPPPPAPTPEVAPPPQAKLHYVALGDSITASSWFARGFPDLYREHIEEDTVFSVTLTNLGQIGWTSTHLAAALQHDPQFRQAIQRAQVITVQIGGNDLLDARSSYKAGTCGGADNQDCLRAALARFQANWNIITDEIATLRIPIHSIVRVLDIYYPFVKEDMESHTKIGHAAFNDFDILQPYVIAANNHIHATAPRRGNLAVAPVFSIFNGPGGIEDPQAKGFIGANGVHPNAAGHRVIANLLRQLSYGPFTGPFFPRQATEQPGAAWAPHPR